MNITNPVETTMRNLKNPSPIKKIKTLATKNVMIKVPILLKTVFFRKRETGNLKLFHAKKVMIHEATSV